MTIPILDDNQLIKILNTQKNPFFEDYYAFYSSWYGGIIKSPHLMVLPMDDHIVHRGDGVFEVMKAINGSVYLFAEHMQRLYCSAENVALKPPISLDDMKKIIIETLRAANKSEAMVRLFPSRGPGNFSVNPYDSIKPQLYVVISRLTLPDATKFTAGVTIGKSAIPVKSPFLAQTKSCNYLPNVMMKKEAIDRGLDFVVGIDPEGYLTESATENIIIVDQNGTIVHPLLQYILKGTTMIRVCELAYEKGMSIATRPISLSELQSAQEVMMTGTTLGILPVVEFEGHPIGNGKPGPVFTKLRELLLQDIQHGIRSVPF